MQRLELILERLNELLNGLVRSVPELAAAAVVLLAAWVVARWITPRIVEAKRLEHLRRSVRVLYGKVIFVSILTSGAVAAAVVLFPDITPGRLFTMLGFGSIAIGFAFKDVLENLVAGLTILGRSTIAMGDYVEFDEVSGRVEEITLRDTLLRTTDGELVLVPNGHVFKSAVRVVTDAPQRRVRLSVGVAYDTDLDQACDVIEQSAATVDSVDTDRGVEALVRRFGDSSIDIDVLWWTDSAPLDVLRSTSDVHRAVKRALDNAGIEIPFPQRVLHMAGAPGAADAPQEIAGPAEPAEAHSEAA